MEVYPGVEIPVPSIALSLLHQSAGSATPESYTERVRQFHQDLRRQLPALREQYARWLQQELEAATERATGKALEATRASTARRGAWEAAIRPAVQGTLAELAATLGIGELLGLRGTAEMVYEPKVVGTDDVSKLTSDGRDYLASLGMQVGEPGRTVQETLLVFDGALFFDLLEGITHDWMAVYAGDDLPGPDQVRQRVFTSANLLHVAGDLLGGAPVADASPTEQEQGLWDGVIFFDKAAGSYDEFRAELRAACDLAHAQLPIASLSLWQRKLGASGGREFWLRFRVPRDEMAVFNFVHLLRNSGQAGRESVVRRGRMVLGQRVW
ncbi:MAG TPA: hypothetical protein VH540_18715 [Ktedonobacterales bacterium]|jgi:hypothetical protein